MKSILFRADSSSLIGHGHIMRDLTLARQIKKKLPNIKIYFATKNLIGNINYKILENAFTLININNDTKKELKSIIDTYTIDFIILDHYEITLKMEEYLNTLCDLLVFDDEFKDHKSKWVLNHSFIAHTRDYSYLKSTKVLAGAQYTLLNTNFLSILSKYIPLKNLNNKNILITLGGSDPLNLSFIIKKYLHIHYKNLNVSIVTTDSNTRLSYLKRVDKDITINEPNMAKLMRKQDLIITSASTSLLEAFALKKPFIAIKCATNQSKTVDVLIEKNSSNIIENFSLSAFKKALNFVQYQTHKIKRVVNKYNFKQDGVIKEILNEY